MSQNSQPEVVITGVLDYAHYQYYADGYILWGNISKDIHGRFYDGQRIHTSKIVAELGDDVFQTLNSVYKVNSWLSADHQ